MRLCIFVFFGEDIGLYVYWLLQNICIVTLVSWDQDGFCSCGKSSHVIQMNLEKKLMRGVVKSYAWKVVIWDAMDFHQESENSCQISWLNVVNWVDLFKDNKNCRNFKWGLLLGMWNCWSVSGQICNTVTNVQIPLAVALSQIEREREMSVFLNMKRMWCLYLKGEKDESILDILLPVLFPTVPHSPELIFKLVKLWSQQITPL